MSVEHIQNLITNTVKAQRGLGSHRIDLYAKPYTKRVDAFCMPLGYQPSKFWQFDEKGNLKHHVPHFIETCNNVDTNNDLIMK